MPDPTMAAPEACIVGWAHTPFGRSEAPDIETLLAQVGRAAIEDAGISPADIDAGFVGVFGEGFTNQGFPELADPAVGARSCASSRSPATRMPAPPALRRSTARSTSSPPSAAASPWCWAPRR